MGRTRMAGAATYEVPLCGTGAGAHPRGDDAPSGGWWGAAQRCNAASGSA